MGTIIKDGINYSGGSGITSYNALSDKPAINGVSLAGNKSSDDLGIITKAVNDLVNYYLKSETYSKTETDTLIAAVKNSRFEAVSSLPTTNIKTNVIYLVPKSSPETGDVKDEYINLDGTTSGWELIGSTEIDLSNYVTVTALNTALADYTTTANLTTLLAAKQDNIQVTTMPTASASTMDRIYQFMGTTDSTYTHGYFYETKESSGTYSWQQVNVQPSSGGGGGGHTIEDSTGTDLTQRDTLQFGEGFLAEDDDTNEKTVISPNLMTSTDMDDVISKLPSVGAKTPRYKITTPRWLRFDPTNKKGLVIKGGTSILLSSGEYIDYGADTHIDLTSDISTNGTDYFVYITEAKEVHAYTEKQSTGTYIGRFHTLCVDAGTMTMIAPASPSSGMAVGGNYLVKSYNSETDSDFYNFYNKSITAVSVGARYDVITCTHPLSGFVAGDILPESVFCLTFHPECLVEDAMVYDKDMNICVDVYLQSGTGFNTRSKYNQTHTVNRDQINHANDFRMVGKRLLSDDEFTSIALGSNEKTNISGSADATRVGGHKDTNNRRMISAIGVEETCGYLWTWLRELITVTNSSPKNAWCTIDGQDSFGQQYWDTHALLAGGVWSNGATCGSRCRYANGGRSGVDASCGGRGSSQVHCFN